MKNGQGKYKWEDGSFYFGDWKNNRIDGYGRYCWVTGKEYEG